MRNTRIETLFPNLQKIDYSITSPETLDYNCIAWAAEDTEANWWPDILSSGYYWPLEIPRIESLEVFIMAFEQFDYSLCENHELKVGFDKIALYVDKDGVPTHAARQLDNGKWTSKLGQLEDIEHDTLDGVAGEIYGTVAVIMERSK